MSDVMADSHSVTKKNSKEHLIFLHQANILCYVHSTICKYFRTRSVSKVIFFVCLIVPNLFGESTFAGMRSLAC